MEIQLLEPPRGDMVAVEYVDGTPEGEFIASADGSVHYRHAVTGLLFANESVSALVACCAAWNDYRRDVREVEGEDAQLEVVERLRARLTAARALVGNSFWNEVVEQADAGLL